MIFNACFGCTYFKHSHFSDAAVFPVCDILDYEATGNKLKDVMRLDAYL